MLTQNNYWTNNNVNYGVKAGIPVSQICVKSNTSINTAGRQMSIDQS